MSAEEKASSRVPRTPENLFIRTNKQLQDFWQTIVRKFVEDVDPESFADELFSDELLTYTSQESLAAGKDGRPRNDRARALWRVLSKHSLEVFRSKIAPRLCESYDWIIPQRFFATQEQQMKITSLTLETDNPCLRHAVQKRLRPETMADLLLSHHCMSMDEHSSIVFGDPVKYSTDRSWDTIFGAFTKVSEDNSGKLLAETKALLERYLVGIPENFPEILKHAFPCARQTPDSCPLPSAMETNEVQFSFSRKALARPHQPSPGSSCTKVDMSTCSLSSSLRPASEAETDSKVSENGEFLDGHSVSSAWSSDENLVYDSAKATDGSAAEKEALLSAATVSNSKQNDTVVGACDKTATSNMDTIAPGDKSVSEKVNNEEKGPQNRSEYYTHFSNFLEHDGFFESVGHICRLLGSCLSAILRKLQLLFTQVTENQYSYHTLRTLLLILLIIAILSLSVTVGGRAVGSPLGQMDRIWSHIGFSLMIFVGGLEILLVIITALVLLVTSCKLLLKAFFTLLESTRICRRCYNRKRDRHMV